MNDLNDDAKEPSACDVSMDEDSSTNDESDASNNDDDPDWDSNVYASDDDEVEKDHEPVPSKRELRYVTLSV